ncbi:MAG: SDR family oxidoreductase [Actinobacteria bacterium]|nr:SDR family oxidoreductase [Actinomycetota bacterium]
MNRTCLVTGASGYVGGRLIPMLLARGWNVRVLVRRPESISQRTWFDDVTVVQGDARDAATLDEALAGVAVAYYLMHSIGSGPQFDLTEREVAEQFAAAAQRQHVGRIVYLGGMAPSGTKLSPHLRSRRSVGEALRGSGVPTIELRAAVVLGSGSASFEMLRYLTERLPAMITPLWVRTKTQPIAVRDVLHYLVEAADVPGEVNQDFDIGGPEVMTYQEMMQRFAKVSGLPPRRILPINVLSPGLSSHWVGLITPVPRGVARPLVESLRVPVVCRDHSIAEIIPDPPGGLLGYDDAVRYAIARVRDAHVDTRWSGASVVGAPSQPLPSDPDWSGGSLYTDVREAQTQASPENVYSVVETIGGETGYFTADWMWEIRGAADRLIGGVGLRRGRRDPVHLRVGDALDFWRVEERVSPEILRLRAEMKLPGLAWLEWRIEPADGGCRIQQRALFYPRGLAGHFYWWAVAPFHAFVFGPMLSRMVARAEALPAPQPASAAA